MSWRWLLAALAATSFLAASARAANTLDAITCPDANIWGSALFNNLCWSQMYPIVLSGWDIFGGHLAPGDASKRHLPCLCGGDIAKGKLPMVGVPLGMWRPTRIVESMRRPWCLGALGGVKLSNAGSSLLSGDATLAGGTIESESGGTKIGYYNVNYYYADFLAMFGLLDAPLCNPGGTVDFDFAQSSTFYPQWAKTKLSSIMNPEVSILAAIGMSVVQPVDCIATSTQGVPLDAAWMTAGCWGALVPYTGNVTPATSAPSMWLLTSTRFISMLARLGMLSRTVGEDALCEGQIMSVLKKSQYRYQMLFPVPQSKGGKPPPPAPRDTTNGGTQVAEFDLSSLTTGCTTPIGDSTLKSMEWRSRPTTGEDAVFLVWQWVDCCSGIIPNVF
ncbi:MAG: hypothetical protein D4R84_07600 [Rhodocyclaceae bacterium]|nr:MAG: hypothetical protein D4R84_07600 [Rhodocyclaceae bacterium]